MTRPEPKSQPMPMDRAILWNPPAAPGATSPGGKSTSRSPYPIFFQQEAVIALQEHLKSSPTQAIFGFLIGDLYRDPETGVLYTVIDKTLKLSQAIYGDKTEVVVSRLWDRMQEQLGKASASLLGWYHSHPGQGGFLTAAHAGWWVMAGCGYAVLVLGVISTTQWARATAAKAGVDS